MRDCNHSSEISPGQRHRELACILAMGLLRLQQLRLLEIRACPDSGQPGLEHVANTVLTVVNPDNAPEATISKGESE